MHSPPRCAEELALASTAAGFRMPLGTILTDFATLPRASKTRAMARIEARGFAVALRSPAGLSPAQRGGRALPWASLKRSIAARVYPFRCRSGLRSESRRFPARRRVQRSPLVRVLSEAPTAPLRSGNEAASGPRTPEARPRERCYACPRELTRSAYARALS